jgi:hypothetical protein
LFFIEKRKAEILQEEKKSKHQSDWRGVSLSRHLLEDIEIWLREHPEAGYNSLSDFIHESIRFRFQEVKASKNSSFKSNSSKE